MPNHEPPSANAMHSAMRANDLPAFDGPDTSILCPILSSPSMSAGLSGGRLSPSMVSSGITSGSSSVSLAYHSSHSSQSAAPCASPARNCRLPRRITPGMRDSLDAFLFALSTAMPLRSQRAYSSSTLSRYCFASAASILTIAWSDLPPESTRAATGRFICLTIAANLPCGISSLSSSA